MSEAEHFVKLLYAEVLYLYEKRIEAEGKTVRPESMGLAARIQHMIARERARSAVSTQRLKANKWVKVNKPTRYKAKLRKVFHLYQASEGSVLRIVELRSRGSNVTRIMFRISVGPIPKSEELACHSFTRRLVALILIFCCYYFSRILWPVAALNLYELFIDLGIKMICHGQTRYFVT